MENHPMELKFLKANWYKQRVTITTVEKILLLCFGSHTDGPYLINLKNFFLRWFIFYFMQDPVGPEGKTWSDHLIILW